MILTQVKQLVKETDLNNEREVKPDDSGQWNTLTNYEEQFNLDDFNVDEMVVTEKEWKEHFELKGPTDKESILNEDGSYNFDNK